MRTRTEVQGIARVSDGLPAVIPERRHELWTRDPAGDLDGCQFDVPKGVSADSIEKACKQTYAKWIDMKAQENMVPASSPVGWVGAMYYGRQVVVFGPFRMPDYDQLDMERRYIVRRWKRTKPLLISLDEAAEYEGLRGPNTNDMYANFFANMRNLSNERLEIVERAAREQKRLEAVARENDEWERERRERFPFLKP